MNEIFVFGSNLAGIHGAGAAKFAVHNHGAIMGVGFGPQGNSYGIATKDENIETLDILNVNMNILYFLMYAKVCPDLLFNVTRIGCGLAGFKDSEIAPMFANAPMNCRFSSHWAPFLKPYEVWTNE